MILTNASLRGQKEIESCEFPVNSFQLSELIEHRLFQLKLSETK